MSVDARGAMGPGIVLGKRRGTNWARQRIRTPINRGSKEQAVKDRLTRGARAWGQLSGADRSGWETYAGTVTRINVFGDTYHVSGQCEFMACYAITVMLGTSSPTSAPVVSNLGAVAGLTVEWQVLYWRVSIAWDDEQALDWIEIFLSPIKSNGIMSSITGDLVIHQIASCPDDMPVHVDLPLEKKMIFRIRGLMDSGQWGVWTSGIIPPGYPV